MEQKDYELEIINELTKENNHIRGLAKNLNVNHMLIKRKIKRLFDNNVIDCKQEGKNKTYLLKKTLEAKIYLYKKEYYTLLNLLKRYPFLRSIIEKIQNNKKVKLAILFGSFAKNLAKKDSDIDIYIETNDKKLKEEISKIDSNLSIKIGKYNKKENVIKELEKNHIILKGVEQFYEK